MLTGSNNQIYAGCDFLKSFVDAMREPDPKKRLTIKQVVDQFNKILKSRWWWQLRAPVYVKPHGDQSLPADAFFSRSTWLLRTARYLLTFKKAMPKPFKQ